LCIRRDSAEAAISSIYQWFADNFFCHSIARSAALEPPAYGGIFRGC
jgi:hypothetical protein